MSWSVAREEDKKTGYRNIAIKNERGEVVANMIMGLRDDEYETAKRIVAAMNKESA